MKNNDNSITLVITYYEGDYEVYLLGGGMFNFEVIIGKFDELSEARAFCDAFERCNNVTTIEDLTDEPIEMRRVV